MPTCSAVSLGAPRAKRPRMQPADVLVTLISICAPGHLASWSPDHLARGHLVTWPPPRCRSLIPGRPGCSSCRPRWRGPSPAWPWTPHVPPAPGRQHQLVSEHLGLGHEDEGGVHGEGGEGGGGVGGDGGHLVAPAAPILCPTLQPELLLLQHAGAN